MVYTGNTLPMMALEARSYASGIVKLVESGGGGAMAAEGRPLGERGEEERQRT
jgi:hypothetical protein